MTAHTLNRRLAELTGWTNIIELGGALLGTPPAGDRECRGQALVPDWAGDWRDCGPLMMGLCVDSMADPIIVQCDPQEIKRTMRYVSVDVGKHLSREAAARAAIVIAVIAKLEAGQ